MSQPSSVAEVEIIDAQAVPPSGAPCPSCGWPVEAADKFCPACGTANAAFGPASGGRQSYGGTAVTAENEQRGTDAPRSRTAPSKHCRCGQCGSEVIVEQEQRSYVCPLCDST